MKKKEVVIDKSSSKFLLKRIFKELVWPYKKILFFAIIFMIIVAGATTLQAWIMKPLLDKIFIEKDKTLLLLVAFSLFCISFAKGVASYIQHILVKYVETYMLINVQRRLFKKIINADLVYFSKFSPGKIVSHFTNDINTLKTSISATLTNVAKEFLSLVFLLALAFYLIPELALVTLFVFPVAIYPVYYLGRKIRKISKKTQIELSVFASQIDETAQGIRVVKAYNAEKFENKRTFQLTETLQKLYKKHIRLDYLTSPLMETLGGIALAVTVYLGGLKAISGEITGGDFFAFITAILSAYKPMKSLSKLNNQVQQGLAAADRLFQLLDKKEKIVSNEKDSSNLVKNGHISFDKVSFAYNEQEIVLSNISFSVKKGETYALIGKSGSGKSTIMNLLLRFYEASDGNIKIDNRQIKNYSLYNLREAIAYVSQDIFLFDDSIRANICYGSKKNVSDKKLQEVAEQAEAYEFIKDLEDGFDTKIGHRGGKLSGGQKQRIVLARAFLKDSPILLLDEATSALDPISEQKVQQALEKLKQGRTCIVIAHRLETIKNADKIIILSKGEIIAKGSHKELQRNKFYNELQLKSKI